VSAICKSDKFKNHPDTGCGKISYGCKLGSVYDNICQALLGTQLAFSEINKALYGVRQILHRWNNYSSAMTYMSQSSFAHMPKKTKPNSDSGFIRQIVYSYDIHTDCSSCNITCLFLIIPSFSSALIILYLYPWSPDLKWEKYVWSFYINFWNDM